MTEYTDKQAAIEAVRQAVIKGYDTNYGVIDSDVVYEILDNLPAADVVPGIRCRDCKYWNNGNVIIGCYWDVDGGQPEETDFCSRGKRKE